MCNLFVIFVMRITESRGQHMPDIGIVWGQVSIVVRSDVCWFVDKQFYERVMCLKLEKNIFEAKSIV